MNAAFLTRRAVRADDRDAVTIEPRAGFVSICTNRLPQPLGQTEALHALALLVGSILRVWHGLGEPVRRVVETAIGQGSAPGPEARS